MHSLSRDPILKDQLLSQINNCHDYLLGLADTEVNDLLSASIMYLVSLMSARSHSNNRCIAEKNMPANYYYLSGYVLYKSDVTEICACTVYRYHGID